jgi:DNA helicase-2/ATP-dependent DNA helicase PcrA
MARKKLIPKKIYNSAEVSFLEFKTEEEELAYIIDRVEEQKKAIQEDENLTEEEKSAPYSNIAVLVRKRESIKKVINVFLKEGIPYATDGKEDIRQEKRVKQMMDVLELANTDIEDKEDRALLLYNVLASDYMRTDHTDLLKFISYVNDLRGKRYRARKSETDSLSAGKTAPLSLVEAFLDYFYPVNDEIPPKGSSLSDTLDLKAPGSLVRAAMAIGRMMKDSVTSTVHDLLLQYIEDVGLYKFILDSYETEKLIRIRELRGLVSFINMIKDASNSDPGLDLRGFVKQLDLRNIHGMPVTGKMATFNREGVRVFTAHASKGLEFHTVIIPFCLDRKNWPVKPRGQVVPLPPDIYKSKEKVKEKKMLKTLVFYDEIRLFYVASTRVRSNIIYTSTPRDKNISSSFLLDAGIKPRTKIFDEEDFLARYINVSKKEDFSASSTEKLLSGIVADMSLNPTSVGTYISCKRKFLYNDVLRLPGKKNQHLAFGNCVHEALENVYTVYKGKNIFPDFDYFKKVFKKELLFQGLKNSVINWCLDRLEGLEYWYRKESTDPVMPLELEQKIEIIFPQGFVFTGKFDKIEPGDAGIRVVDYKTGKPDKHIKSIHNCKDIFDAECDNYYRQLISYKLLYDRARGTRSGDRVTEGKLHFVEPVGESVKKYAMKKGDFFDIDIALRDDMAGDMERLISDIWAGIQSLDFRKLERRDGKGKCRICPYDSLCWG